MSQLKDERISTEEFKVNGGALVDKVKELIHEGNVRRIIIKNTEGKTLIEVPLTVGVLAAAIAPVVAAVGAVAAMAADFSIVVERDAGDTTSDQRQESLEPDLTSSDAKERS